MRIALFIMCLLLSAELFANPIEKANVKDVQNWSDSIKKAYPYHMNDKGYKEKIYKWYYNIIQYYLFKKDYHKCISNAMDFLQFAKKSKVLAYQIEANKLLSVINMDLNRLDAAILYTNTLSDLAWHRNDTATVIQALLGKAKINDKWGNRRLSEISLFYSLFLCEKSSNEQLKAVVYKDIGYHYMLYNEYSKALYNFRNSIKINEKYHIYTEVGVIYTVIGHISQLNGWNEQSIKYGHLALNIRKNHGAKELYLSSVFNLGNSFLAQGKLDSAYFYFKEGEKQLLGQNKYNLIFSAYKSLYDYYYLVKDYNNALIYYKKYSIVADSMSLEKSKNQISMLEANQLISEIEIKTKYLHYINQLQSKEINNKRIQIYLLSFLVISFLIIIFFIYYFLQKLQREKKVQTEMIQKLNDEIINKKFLEYDSRSKELDYRFLNDHNPDLIIRENYSFIKKYVSPASLPVLGYTPEEMMEVSDFPIYIHEDSKEQWLQDIEKIKNSNRTVTIVFKAKRKDNTTIWAECLVNPIKNENEPVEMISVIRDISERYELTEEMREHARNKELLMREVNHRVKNNMGILLSLVRMHQFKFEDEKMKEMLRDLQYRVKTMALVHDQLNRNKSINDLSTGVYFSDLIKGIVNALKKDEIEVNTFFYEEMIHVGIIQPLGLIINETMTNCFKYAFPDNRKGNIWIKYEKVPGDTENLRKLSIVDDGVGFTEGYDFAEGERMGSELVVGLSKQLNGEIIIDGSNGVSFTITLPVSGGTSSETI